MRETVYVAIAGMFNILLSAKALLAQNPVDPANPVVPIQVIPGSPQANGIMAWVGLISTISLTMLGGYQQFRQAKRRYDVEDVESERKKCDQRLEAVKVEYDSKIRVIQAQADAKSQIYETRISQLEELLRLSKTGSIDIPVMNLTTTTTTTPAPRC
jgi:hypothetical protein